MIFVLSGTLHFQQLYLMSLYFTTTTVCFVGFGDIHPSLTAMVSIKSGKFWMNLTKNIKAFYFMVIRIGIVICHENNSYLFYFSFDLR